MATHVQNMGAATKLTAATSQAITPSANQASLGNKLILAVQGSNHVTSVTDSKGNTWTVDSFGATGTTQASICSCTPTSALTTGDTITVTLASATAIAYTLEEFSGLQAVAPDTTGTNFTASGQPATLSVTTTGDDLLFAAWSFFTGAALTFTPTSGWTGGQSAQVNSRYLIFEWIEEAAAGSYDTSGAATSTSNQNAGALVAYKATAAPPAAGAATRRLMGVGA